MTPDRSQQSNGSLPSIGQPFNPYKRFNGAFIPEAICKYKGVSPGAKLVYGRLCRYAGEDGATYPAIPTLAAETGMSETQARRYIRELEAKRFIEVDRENRHYRKDGSGGSNGYTFLWHAAFTGDRGEQRKSPPPLRKTEGVPLRKTAPLTPAVNRTQRESVFSRESVEESVDYQLTNRTNRDSHAGDRLRPPDANPEHQRQEPKPSPSEEGRTYTEDEIVWMAECLNRYGRGPTMCQYMQEVAPRSIVLKCLEAAAGTPLRDIDAILRHRCVRGCDPGSSKGPRGWGWFATVIANAIRGRREQEAAAQDTSLRKHWSDYSVPANPEFWRAASAFDTLDDLEATA
jgi:hypothetical protein